MRIIALIVSILAGLPAMGQDSRGPELIETSYLCDRGVVLPVVYANDVAGDGIAVAVIDGHLVAMRRVVSGSGARYRSTEDLPYELWSKADEAVVSYGPDGNTTVILHGCVVLEQDAS